MPRGYKRKSDRQSWSEESMRSAVEAVLSKELHKHSAYLRQLWNEG